MSYSSSHAQFDLNHPHPASEDIKSLFRFFKMDIEKPEHLRDLFVDAKLYHNIPEVFNDPFECKPNFVLPTDINDIGAIRKHLLNLVIEDGQTNDEAKIMIDISLNNTSFIEENIRQSVQNTLNTLRICSFTTRKENLLFWSHYAAAHKGFCVEFDATKLPISYAFKVNYSDEYPEVHYPILGDSMTFRPALIKSKEWEYEQEFRTIFFPRAKIQPSNNGESLLLEDQIKKIYFGSRMEESDKRKIIEMVRDGPFAPEFWNSSISKSSFALNFTPCTD